MANSKPGLFTPVTGRVGGVVYYYRNGKQVQRIWVKPVDRKSTAQVATRLKFSLAGRLSGVVPAEALEGMSGVNAVQRRSAFTRNVMKVATVENGSASIADGDILFSEGSLALGFVHSAAPVTPTSSAYRRVDITLSSRIEVLPEGYGERYVVMFLNGTTSRFDYVETGLLTIPAEGATATTNVVCYVGDREASYTALVYVYPFAFDGRAATGGMSVSGLGASGSNVVVDLETGEVVPSGIVYGTSLLINRMVLNPPTQAAVQVQEGDRRKK